MKQNPLILPIVGGGIAFLCFFLPWIKIDMSSLGLDQAITQLKGALTISGFKMATGNGNLITLALIATVAIIGICIYMLYEKTPWKSRIPVLICSGIGFLLVLFTLIRLMQGISEGTRLAGEMLKSTTSKMELDKIVSFQFGGFGTVIGFVLALIGAWNIPKSNASMEDNEQDIAA